MVQCILYNLCLLLYNIMDSSMMGGCTMFNIGDKVVYPMNGAGVIEGIEQKETDHTFFNLYINIYIDRM